MKLFSMIVIALPFKAEQKKDEAANTTLLS